MPITYGKSLITSNVSGLDKINGNTVYKMSNSIIYIYFRHGKLKKIIQNIYKN